MTTTIYRRPRSIKTLLCFVTVIAGVSISSNIRAAERVEEFFGTWVPHADQPLKCEEVLEWGEGPQLIIGKEHYEEGDAAPCKEVGMWIHQGKLRVSASCINPEQGYHPFTGDFTLSPLGLLSLPNGKEYSKCIE